MAIRSLIYIHCPPLSKDILIYPLHRASVVINYIKCLVQERDFLVTATKNCTISITEPAPKSQVTTFYRASQTLVTCGRHALRGEECKHLRRTSGLTSQNSVILELILHSCNVNHMYIFRIHYFLFFLMLQSHCEVTLEFAY